MEIDIVSKHIKWLENTGSPWGNFIRLSVQEKDEILSSLRHYKELLEEKAIEGEAE